MPPSTKSSFTNKKLRMAAQERELFARTVGSNIVDHSDEDFPSRQPSRTVRADSNGGYYYQRSILKPAGSPPRANKKRVSFTEDPAHGISSGSSSVSAASEGPFWVIDPEVVFDRRHQESLSASRRNSIVNKTPERSPVTISGVFPTLKQATTKTEHLSVQIGTGVRYGDTLDDYTYYFPAPTALNRLGRPQEEEFPALYCSRWQRDGHCPCFNCARHRRTLRQTPLRGKKGNLPRFPPATPPTSSSSFSGFVRRDNVTITDILVAAGVYTPVSELNYGTQVFELKERQNRLRIRQAKALQKASDEHDERKKQVRESIIRAATSASAKTKKTPAPTKSTVQGYQAWCDQLFRDANEEEDAIALTDVNMNLIENDLTNTNNYDTFVDPESEHEWDEDKRSLLRLYNDRATRCQIDATIYIDTNQQPEQQTGTTTAKTAVEKKQKEIILNPLTFLRLLQKQISLDKKHKGILSKLYRQHAEQESELFNEYPDLEDRFYELVGIPSQASGTSDGRWWSSWLSSI